MKVASDKVQIDYGPDRVEMQIPIDGRMRKLVFAARDALRVSNVLGNAAVDALPPIGENAVPEVQGLKLLPFGHAAGPAHALLRLELDQGPLIVRIDANWLRALADASEAALEFSNSGGGA